MRGSPAQQGTMQQARKAVPQTITGSTRPSGSNCIIMIIEEIAKKVRLEVLEALAPHPWVNVAVDGWEDHQKHPTLAFTVSSHCVCVCVCVHLCCLSQNKACSKNSI